MKPSGVGALVIGIALLAACGGSSSQSDNGLEAGSDAGLDPGDTGIPDAGDAGLPDGGPGDAGGVPLPTAEGWTFYSAAHGGPKQALGITADQGGNIWVAGGEDGLFLLRKGATTLERFTIAEGLHPYGYPRADQGTITQTYLNVISVAGGPPGTVFVGYGGMPVPEGVYNCEDNWDGPNPDPSVYKSGDADRVTLTATGIRVVHYDISTGLNIVRDEPRGREKICDVYRIVYDAASASVWFGGNHGYAWGDPSYAGNPTCFGQWACSGVREHAHPLLNGYPAENSGSGAALTNYYYGLAVAPGGDLWVGGMFRSQRCAAGMRGAGFWDCESAGLSPANQIDWWPDAVPTDSRPSQRVDDHVSAIAIGGDGSVWVGSFTNGLARVGADGSTSFITTGLVDPKHVTSVKVDPADGSVWVGANYGGVTRIKGGQFIKYDYSVFGIPLVTGSVPDIQADTSGGGRRMLVAFKNGAIGIYDGE